MGLYWIWLWIDLTAAWAAQSSQEPVWAGAPDANGYPTDCPVAPPRLTFLISGSLRLMKASLPLPGPAGRAPRSARWRCAAPAARGGRGAPSGAPGGPGGRGSPGPQAALDPPHEEDPPLGPSSRGALFTPDCVATAIADGIRRLRNPPCAEGDTAKAQHPLLPQLPLRCHQALSIGATLALAAPYRQPLSGGAPANPPVLRPPPADPPHVSPVPLRGPCRGPPWHAVGDRSVQADSARPPIHSQG